MQKRLDFYRGSVAFGMTGYGPKPTFAPPGEGGNGGNDDDGGEGSGDGDGAGGDDGGDKSGTGDDGEKGGRIGKLGGLFAKRSNGQQQQQGDGDPEPEQGQADADGRPKGLADKFWNPDKKEIRVEALMAAHRDAEKALGELKRQKGPGGGEVPETAEGYFAEGVKLPDTVERLSVAPDDPGLKAWASICKKEGIGKDLATRLMTEMFVQMDEFAPAPIDPEREMEALGKSGPSLVDGLFVWAEGLETAGQLSNDDIDVIAGLSKTASGIRFLAKMRNMSGEKPIPVDPGGGVRGMSSDQLDEAYKKAVKEKNYAEQERLDALRNQINPDGLAPGISGRQGGYSI